MPRKPSPEEARALQTVLEGSFAFHGLISALPELPTPLLEWKYRLELDGGYQTVWCGSTEELPHGHDAVVLQALLDLHERTPLPDGHVVCSGETLREATASQSPELRLTDEQVHAALQRLKGASFTMTLMRGGRGRTLHFSLLDDLELSTRVKAEVFSLDTMNVQLSSQTLRLGQGGGTAPSAASLEELLELDV